MSVSPLHKVGDWIRFYQNGKLVIGVVNYIVQDTLGYWQYYTDVGAVREDSVLDVRRETA